MLLFLKLILLRSVILCLPPDGRTLGLNIEMPELKALFDSGKSIFY